MVKITSRRSTLATFTSVPALALIAQHALGEETHESLCAQESLPETTTAH